MTVSTNSGFRDTALWIGTGFLAFVFLVAGVTKLIPLDPYVVSFERWGYPVELVYAVGIVEILAALAVLWPKTSWLGALVIDVVMLAAAVTFVIHAEWMVFAALALGGLSSWLLYERRAEPLALLERLRRLLHLGDGGRHTSSATS